MSLRKISWRPEAFIQFDFWLRNDRKTALRIMDLLSDVQRDPFAGKGKPEPLRHELKGFWSRRITDEHRLVYKASDDEISVYSCRFHYKK